MCGIVGIVSHQDVSKTVIEGLKRLEYRGYDSAGVATINNGGVDRRRASGKLINLDDEVQSNPLSGNIGIGHTRWATHGLPNTINAHPHATDKVAVVHNGIIENYQNLKHELISNGVQFESETDTEVIVQLITYYMNDGINPHDAVNKTLDRLEGAYALAIIFAGEDNLMIGARQGTPLAVGYGDNEMFLASDSYALAPMTNKIAFLEDGDRVVLNRDGVEIRDLSGNIAERRIRISAQSVAMTGKGDYRHFMLKEIYEQPAVISDTLKGLIHNDKVIIGSEILNALKNTPRLTLIACGTAYYACVVAKYWFEQIARIPCEIDVASEFRYREAPMPKDGVALFVSQSGETLDTLEALRYCKSQGQKILSIVNTIESTIERESDYCLHTKAGPEIAVASTKATTCQLTTLACLTLAAAVERNVINDQGVESMINALQKIPAMAAQILNHDDEIAGLAADIKNAEYVLYLGRGSLFPIAMEGALKLKEVSYITSEGLAAGEMKHGPIALIDETVPVVVLAPSNDPLFEKTVGNISETVARNGQVLLFSDKKGVKHLFNKTKWSVGLDEIHPFTAPILYAIPMQLLAYHVAVCKGTDVDQPRNLAKSVTVE
jgi:glucosamine--fructose-6-phosphate aminotransferase (isomerizing)